MVLLASSFLTGWLHRLIIVLLSCVPIIESRYAIVIGKTLPAFELLHDKTGELFVLTQLGAFFVTLVLLLLLRPVIEWMKKTKIIYLKSRILKCLLCAIVPALLLKVWERKKNL